jgi:hypothetical protein
MLLIPCIGNEYFIMIYQQINFVFTWLYYSKTLKVPTCFDPWGIIIRESVNQLTIHKLTTCILYKSLDVQAP